MALRCLLLVCKNLCWLIVHRPRVAKAQKVIFAQQLVCWTINSRSIDPPASSFLPSSSSLACLGRLQGCWIAWSRCCFSLAWLPHVEPATPPETRQSYPKVRRVGVRIACVYLGPNESLFHSTDVSLYTMPLHIGVFLGFRCLTLFSCPSSPLSAAFIRAQIASLPKAFAPMTPATLQKQQGCVTRGPPVPGCNIHD